MRLISCSHCARHYRADEAVCPFCQDGTPRVGPRGLAAAALIGASLTALGCSSRPQGTLYGAPPEPQPSATSEATSPLPSDSSGDADKDAANKDKTPDGDASADPVMISPPVKALYGAPPAPDQNRD